MEIKIKCMQENEFEKKVREQMEEFELVPNEEVWKQVEEKIRKEKRKRTLAYWLFAALLLTGGAVTLLINHNSNHGLTNISLTKKTSGGISSNKHATIKKAFKEKGMIKEDTKVQKEILPRSLINKKIKVSRFRKTFSFSSTLKKDFQIQAKLKGSTSVNKENKKLQQDDTRVVTSEHQIPPTNKTGVMMNFPSDEYGLSNRNNDTVQKSITVEPVTGIRDTSALTQNNNAIKPKNKESNSTNWQLGFTIYGGTSDNTRGIELASNKSLEAAYQSASFSSQSSFSASRIVNASRLQYKSGASFGAGAYVQKKLTKKVSLTVGIDYHFMSAKSKAGNKVDSALNIYDSILQKPTLVNSFYRAGQTTSFSNRYHLIQLPVNLQVQLNKNLKHPLLFSAGLSPSFLIASKALYLKTFIATA
jgi:hypothetical protein